MIRIANVNDLPSSDLGMRVLVTRKWPRGIPKDAVDLWVKDLGCSLELLKEYKKKKVGVAGFHARYRAEVSEPGRRELMLDLQRRVLEGHDLIILCDGEDEESSIRSVLKEILETT